MRRPKIILVENDSAILDVLGCFLPGKGYEVKVSPKLSFCSVYKNPDLKCTGECSADLLIIDFESYESGKLKLLRNQAVQGCKIDGRNKCIISNDLDGNMGGLTRELGYVYFEKPFKLSKISKWLDDCTSRMVKRCDS